MKEKYIGQAPIKQPKPDKPLKVKLGEKSVLKKNLSDELKYYIDKVDDLQNQIDSLSIHGMAVSNCFGNDSLIGVSQKALTEAFHRVWSVLGDITGMVYEGISMEISPTSYYGDEGCILNIRATTYNAVGKFESIKFFYDSEEEPFLEGTDAYDVRETITLKQSLWNEEQVVIRCEAKIMGRLYKEQRVLSKYDAFWIGSSDSPLNIINDNYRVTFNSCMRGVKDVVIPDLSGGAHIFIVMGKYLEDSFIRADINGVEIEFTKSSDVEIPSGSGNLYTILTSVNTYQAGTINVDING